MATALHECVAQILRRNPGTAYSAREIAVCLTENPDDYIAKKWQRYRAQGRTEDQFRSQLLNEIYSQKNAIINRHNDIVIDTSAKPFKFYAK